MCLWIMIRYGLLCRIVHKSSGGPRVQSALQQGLIELPLIRPQRQTAALTEAAHHTATQITT